MAAPVVYYWDGEIKPFSCQDEVNVEDLPSVGDIIWTREAEGPEDDDISSPVPAIVEQRSFELYYQKESEGVNVKSDNAVMVHRIVLKRTDDWPKTSSLK